MTDGAKGNTKEGLYWVSFVGEAVMNPDFAGYEAGRVEIYSHDDSPYAKEEIRYFTKSHDAFSKFREVWDWEDLTPVDLEWFKYIVDEFFNDPIEL